MAITGMKSIFMCKFLEILFNFSGICSMGMMTVLEFDGLISGVFSFCYSEFVPLCGAHVHSLSRCNAVMTKLWSFCCSLEID